MITIILTSVKKFFELGKVRQSILLSIIALVMFLSFGATVVLAQNNRPDNAVGYYKEGKWNFN